MKYYLIPALLLLIIALFVYLIPTWISRRYYKTFRRHIQFGDYVRVNGNKVMITSAPDGCSWVEFKVGKLTQRTDRNNCYPV